MGPDILEARPAAEPDPRGVADALAHNGHVVLSGFVESSQRTALTAAARRCAFARASSHVGPVTQRAEQATVSAADMSRLPEIAELTSRLETLLIHVHSPVWRPNEATFTRYRGNRAGLSTHRDSRRYVGVVALVTLAGQADIEILADRCGPVLHRWCARPGDLCLLRGWCPATRVDPRPFHRVGPPVGSTRLILALRQNADGGDPPLAVGNPLISG
jgi:hypothetical protein